MKTTSIFHFPKINILAPMRSLRVRLFFIIIVAGILPSIFMRYGIVSSYEKRAVMQRTASVQNQLIVVSNHLQNNNYLTEYRNKSTSYYQTEKIIEAELEMLANLYDGRVMIIDSNFKIAKDTYDLSEGKIIISEEVIKCFNGENTSHYDDEHGYIEITTPIVSKYVSEDGEEKKSVQGIMLTSISTESIEATMEIIKRNALIVEAIAISIIFGLAFVLSGMMTKPFNKITDSLNEIKNGYSTELVSVPDFVETVHIVDAFNKVLNRMRTLDESRQDFVANVSHELKTPMASIKVLADSIINEKDVPVEIYREFMEDIVSEIDRENSIITDLLALVKLDKNVDALNIAPTNVNELVELILKRLRPIARKKDVEIVFESNRTVIADIDEVKITLALTNLVENAIKYNVDHGWVKVILDADHQFFTLEVSDSGIGIPEEAINHIYERFYRVDKSHSREIGGTGLGLAITRRAIIMHQGSIMVTSHENEGTDFIVKLPLNYIEK